MKGRKPTPEEQEWLDAICDLGCIVCILFYGVVSPCSPHHLDGKTKPGAHKKTIGLCGRHHQIPGEGYATRHGPGQNAGKAVFEKWYGTEQALHAETTYLLELKNNAR